MNKIQRFTNTGIEIIKNELGGAVKSLLSNRTDTLTNDNYRGLNGRWFFGADGSEIHFSYAGHRSCLDAYTKCPIVTAVINRKAQAFINGTTYVMNSRGREASGEMPDKLKKLLKKPNPLQSWSQFEAQVYIYTLLFGYCAILPIKPNGFENIYSKHLWCIPPFMIEIEEKDKLPLYNATESNSMVIKSVKLKYKNDEINLPVDDLILIKDFTPSVNSIVIPDTRIRSLEMPINNIIGAYESRNVLINYRGALGMLSSDPGGGQYAPTAITHTEKQDLQNDFQQYGIRRGQWNVILTSASLKWQQMGYATKDLMLFEEITDDLMRICDSYNYPSQLLSTLTGPSVSNTKEYKQQVYQDGIIPESISIYEQLNHAFKTEKYNINLQKDYSHIPVLQLNRKEEAETRKTLGEELRAEFYANLITLNRVLELLGEDQRTDGNIYFSDAKKNGMEFALPGAASNNNQQATGQQPNNNQNAEENGQ